MKGKLPGIKELDTMKDLISDYFLREADKSYDLRNKPKIVIISLQAKEDIIDILSPYLHR